MYVIRSVIKEQFLPLISHYIMNYQWDNRNEFVKKWHNYLFKKGKYFLEGPYIYFTDFESDNISLNRNVLTIKGSGSSENDINEFYNRLLKHISETSTICDIVKI